MTNRFISKKTYTKYSIQTFCFKTKFINHNSLKDKLLNFFDSIDEKIKIFDEKYSDSISKLDWSQRNDFERPWCKFIDEHLKQNLNFMIENIGYESYEMSELWFQQYVIGDTHGWHIHGGNLTGVYYLEFPDNAPSTQLVIPFNQNEIISLDVSEGDIVLFPSHIIHRAPFMTNENRKTIISFNINTSHVNSQILNALKKLDQNNV